MTKTAETIRYLHFDLGKGSATLAFRVADSTAYIAAAFCSPKDQFSRKRGRQIAEGRLSKNKLFASLTLDSTRSHREQIKAALNDGKFHGNLPSWA